MTTVLTRRLGNPLRGIGRSEKPSACAVRGAVGLLLLLASMSTLAQDARRRFDPVPEVPANGVSALVEDERGFIWLGGEDGVARFDGRRLERVASRDTLGAASLGGAIARRVRGRLILYREPAALLGRAGIPPLAPVTLPAGGRLLWDARFAISNETGRELSIAPFGGGEEARARAEAEGLPVGALAAAPAVVEAEGEPARLASRAPGLKVASLAEERFFGRILRFA